MSTRPEDLHLRLKTDLDPDIDKEDLDMPPQQTDSNLLLQLGISALSGILFGISIEKGRVFEPQMIRNQMLFSNFTMLKMFLSASATGMIAFSLLTMIPATSKKMKLALIEFFSGLRTKGFASAAVGGGLLGVGMTLSGACPGMVLAQVGAGVPNSVYTMLGGFCGVYLYALSEPVLTPMFRPARKSRYDTLNEYMSTPYFILACPLAAILGLAVFTVEVLYPWHTQVEISGSGILGSRAWPPYVAGMIIGCLQIPTVLSVQDTLGSATSYVTIGSQILVLKPLQKTFEYMKKYMRGLGNWWQVFYVSGAILGARLSASASDTIGTVEGIGHWYSFFGGLVMLYGSRLAGGCTSGHGLSGMGLLALISFVAVPSMFAGGISTAFLMKYGLGVTM
ncbi:uncharacterized protein LOC106061817 isoform X2 [Biomphalaria glabrata]|nr:uncharacterized protein LOC106061817 isoform X2 [Biomphalaria glabrata]XP_013075486.1 uncharacterized protein LOC106061817 isoform X2 [Biomphalaria glabrata]XP_055878513.1 uncharacterized protein LOC106061817 isoform X2 [Biomphalaria glabrata]XP_055878514.1 uncharacterized protein LOC106061817 isoform X2 [Biomphalaria glabrata]XP_055878516.1 uncharacterized protein LOC106061817 isoform X2 [Biomphalaria glabrata]XP_055878517.1 uncharacterized protein LOC106061817 isoform X2 [Biomphalaria gla